MDPESEKSKREAIRSFVLMSSAGLGMVFETGLAVYLGWVLGGALDKKFGTAPWMAVVGVVLLVSASIYHVMLVMKKLEERSSQDEKNSDKSSQP